jgi:riboflavin synthase
MFTGLIEATGRIEWVKPTESGRLVRVAAPLGASLAAGESVAVSGVCLTVASADPAGFEVALSPETLRATTFESARAGRLVNLERPIAAGARFGGHFVLGHVDGVGRIASLRPEGECRWIDFDAPGRLDAFFIDRGSIAVDGVSLTIARRSPGRISVQLVPFTCEHTAFIEAEVGDPVNMEADMIGKHLAQLLATTALGIGSR